MLSCITEKIWGTQPISEDTESPGQSTTASEDGLDGSTDVAELSCSVWEVDGTEAQEVISDATVAFEEETLVLLGQSGRRQFAYAEMIHFHQPEEDIFQWIIKKNADSLEEFGVVFTSSCHAAKFNRAIRPKLRATADLLCREPIEFREYDREKREWDVVEPDASISILQRQKDFEAFLVVSNVKGDVVLSEIGVSNEEYIFPQKAELQLSWWGPGQDLSDSQRKMYAGKFADSDVMNRVVSLLQKVVKQRAMETAMVDEAGCYDNQDFDMGAGEEDVVWLDAEEPEISAENIVCKDTTRRITAAQPSSKIHKLMFVGTNRTFVVRGPASAAKAAGNTEMQVLKFDDSGKQEIVATLDSEKLKYGGGEICPSKALLHDGEQKILLMDERNSKNVYMMDIEREKVVESYSAGDMTIQNMMPSKGTSKGSHDPTFLCSNPTSIFTMDTRCGKDAESSAKTTALTYATNVQFTTGASDEKGHILMGSKMGDMRLYDGEANKEGKFKRAKTHLQGLGDPLLHVAVTRDGSWILGTCAKYLVLFPVKLAGSGKSGFVTALGKSKPPPIVLKLTMEDMLKYDLKNVNFTKAEFNDEETAIVTSTGNLAIIWDFNKAVQQKEGGVGAYTVRAVDDYIKEVDFVRTAGAESIIMATPCNVTAKPIKQV